MGRFRDHGFTVGYLPTGPLNSITDVSGVFVGHCTLMDGRSCFTGVTAIIPHGGNIFREKVRASVHVINGFGKATGLPQVKEMGVIETPVILTNTLSVGTAWDALCGYMLRQDGEIGKSAGTVNPIVAECNDGFLNDIRGRYVKERHVLDALESAARNFVQEGSFGAGTGMSCLGFKGGIGTSSRIVGGYSLGVLSLCNFGSREDLIIDGVPLGRILAQNEDRDVPPGSVVVVVATDAPVCERQLGRMAKRCQGGLAKVGSSFSGGSGDFVVAFTTANKVCHEGDFESPRFLKDNSHLLDSLFRGVLEATEESVINALFSAETLTGRDGNRRSGLLSSDVLNILKRR